MLIDWFTVGAQALNFLILVGLMRRYLYKPVLDAIDAREARVAAELADADAKRASAKALREEFEQKNTDLDAERDARMKAASDEAEEARAKLLEEARREAEAWSAKRQSALQRESRELSRAIGLRTQREVFALARKALSDLATTSLEAQMAAVFAQRLRDAGEEATAELAEAVRTSSDPALVRSAFELPPEARATIQRALDEAFSAKVPTRFEASPELVSGIELSSNGLKVSWSVADYLTTLEGRVTELLDAPSDDATALRVAPEDEAEPEAAATRSSEPREARRA